MFHWLEVLKFQSPAFRMICTIFLVTAAKFVSFSFKEYWVHHLVPWQVYYVYGFMLLVFVILIIVTICVTIVGTYFLLNAENYHWQWTSFFSAASTALYVYLYSIYYYHVKTKMSGFFQTSFYFGYTLMFCLGLGILCGEFLNYFSFHFKLTQVLFWHLSMCTCRCCWIFGLHSICEENLQKYQMRLNLVEAVSMSCHSTVQSNTLSFWLILKLHRRLLSLRLLLIFFLAYLPPWKCGTALINVYLLVGELVRVLESTCRFFLCGLSWSIVGVHWWILPPRRFQRARIAPLMSCHIQFSYPPCSISRLIYWS